jgi:phage terminase large subunit-like protein
MGYDFACPDWVARLERGDPPMADLPLDRVAADRAVGIFNNLRLPDVAGHPLMADACGDWFRALVSAAFGSADPVTRERNVGEIFCLVPKKNSKTTNSAALGLTALLENKTPNAQMLIIGPTKDVALTCFNQAVGMINADPVDPDTGRQYLVDRFHVVDNDLTITDRITGAELAVKSFSAKVITGKIPILTIIDELHILGSDPNAAKVLAQIRGGMITRPDCLLLFITTQSDAPPAGVFRAELLYARRVRDGEIKGGNMLPCLYEFPEAMQLDKAKPYLDPKRWGMVLPNLGRSITLPRLARLYQKAVETGPDEEMIWASQHLNIQIGMGKHAEGWIGADYWEASARPLSLDDILATSDVVTVGVDGGGLDDLFGVGVIGRHRETRAYQAWGRAWVQPVALDRRKDISTRLRDFVADGDLVICEDPTADLREIAALCKRISDLGLFPEKHGIGLDPYGVAALIDALSDVQIEGEILTAVGQGTRLSPSVWGAERKLSDGTMIHADQPLMNWCVGNAKSEQRGNAVLITKAASGKAKIDPLIGIFNAFHLMARNPEASGGAGSPWDDPNFSMS